MAHLDCGFFAETLGVNTSMQVILPQATGTGQVGMEGTARKDSYPVLYLLHGWSDDDSTWMRRTSIERYVADLGLVVVMPRVELSYYQNMASGMRFWDFISEELPSLCQQWFPVSTAREDTFAAGLSMGGYGAFRLGLSHPDRYAAVASLSGVMDIRANMKSIRNDDRSDKREAIFGPDCKRLGAESDLFHLTDCLVDGTAQSPRFYQWCGTEDYLYQDNRRFRDHAKANGLDLTYLEGPGDHSWEQWDREIQPVLHWLAQA